MDKTVLYHVLRTAKMKHVTEKTERVLLGVTMVSMGTRVKIVRMILCRTYFVADAYDASYCAVCGHFSGVFNFFIYTGVSYIDSMNVKLPTEPYLEFLILKGGYTGLSESNHVKMPHCWKSHVRSQLYQIQQQRI